MKLHRNLSSMTFLNANGFNSQARSYSVFRDLTNRIDESNNIVISDFKRLSMMEASNLYRNSNLARKIVDLYPKASFNFGYELKDKDGNILDKDNDIILNAFLEASIHSRIYGHCFIYFELSDNKIDKPVTNKELTIDGYKLFYRMVDKRDFWEKDEFIYHKDRVILFQGVKNFLPLDYVISNKDASFFSDSILDSLVSSLYDNFITRSYSKYILENLSYLLVGMSGLSAKVASGTNDAKKNVEERMNKINLQRNVSRLFTYDLNNEDIKFITQTLSGVKDLLQEFKENVAVESDIPYDKLFETGSGGSMGGSGIQNQLVARFLWTERKHDWSKENWLPHYKELFTKLKKIENNVVEIPFNSQLTEIEKAELQNIGADRIKKLIESGVISATEARTGYRESNYNLNISLEDDKKLVTEKLNSNNPDETQNTNQENADLNSDAFELMKIVSKEDWDEIANIDFEDVKNLASEVAKIG